MLNQDRAPAVQIDVADKLRAQRYRRIFLVALAWLLGPSVALVRGQTYLQSVGSPTFSTNLPIENGYIDASNGRLHLEVPMGSYPQRGGRQYTVGLVYDSAIWTHAGTTSWQPTNVSAAGCYPGSPTNSWSGWRLVTSGDGCVNYTNTWFDLTEQCARSPK